LASDLISFAQYFVAQQFNDLTTSPGKPDHPPQLSR